MPQRTLLCQSSLEGSFTISLCVHDISGLAGPKLRPWAGGKEDMDSPATRYIGRIGLKGDVVRRHVGSESEILAEMKTERERRDVMKRVCNVEVAEEDLKYMKGRVASLLFDE